MINNNSLSCTPQDASDLGVVSVTIIFFSKTTVFFYKKNQKTFKIIKKKYFI